MTIMRLWHGRVSIEKADKYHQFMIDKAAPDYGSVEGLLKLYSQRRDEGAVAHFLLVFIWKSMEAIKKFAGAQPELAKYYTEDDNFLLEKEKHVTMYDVFYET